VVHAGVLLFHPAVLHWCCCVQLVACCEILALAVVCASTRLFLLQRQYAAHRYQTVIGMPGNSCNPDPLWCYSAAADPLLLLLALRMLLCCAGRGQVLCAD
jgi:hypothetical protein